MDRKQLSGVDRVSIAPVPALGYASYILQGLADVLGPGRLCYETGIGPDMVPSASAIAFVVRCGDRQRHVYVDCGDSAGPDPAALAWADVMGKVNVFPGNAGDGICPIGPTFGIRVRPGALEARSLLASYDRPRWRDASYSYYFLRGATEHTFRRTRIDSYQPGLSDPNYAFYVAWPWKKHPEVNPPRAAFIRACRAAPGLEFEGGFAPRRQNDLPEWNEFFTRRRYRIDDYLSNVRRSVVAFSNPAVHQCLGWKLGEFLALGKAIVTLPLERALPSPLDHGVHVHQVDGSQDSISEALSRIRTDANYRRRLETNARAWFTDHLQPAVVVRRLLHEVGAEP
ncbi:MAG TPA: hypothetical protein VG184_06880 [Acidimicrobiales bacterium]|nr:hypothetical protein [Acidimicrobiales bacterium]